MVVGKRVSQKSHFFSKMLTSMTAEEPIFSLGEKLSNAHSFVKRHKDVL